MSEIPIPTPSQTFSRRVRLEDFLDEDETPSTKNKHNKNYSHNNDTDTIAKNQQEFGHRKRIKP